MVTSAWFDYNGYMANKLVQVQKAEPAAGWDMAKLVKAFSDAGFADAVGAEKHFEEFGQYEEVAPNAFFNATEYFRAKAAQFYEKAPKAVTDLEVASMQLAIKNAGMSAWSHYEMFGNAEKVNPSNSFDTEAYMNAKLTALNSVKDGKQWTLAELNDAFKNAGLSALEHFMTYGGAGDGEVTQKIVDGKIPAEFAVPEAKKVNSGGSGNTYALTTGVDTLVGSGGDDTFNAVLAAGDSATYSPGDTVDGNGGKDTFNLAASTNVSSNLASIKGMTDVNLTIATSGAFTADMSDFAGVDTFNVKANAAAVTIGGVSKDAVVNVGNLKAIATIGFSDVAGADDTAVVGLTGTTTTAGAVIAGVEKLTLQTVGADSVLGSVTLAATKTLTIAGHDDLTIGTLVANGMKTLIIENDEGFVSIKADETTANALTKVDAAKNEGGLYLDLAVQSAASTLSFTGGKGDDTLSMKYTLIDATDSIKGGDGYDTFVINAAVTDSASITTALNKVVSGFEVLGINASTTSAIAVSDFTNGITDFLLYGQSTATSATATFTDSLSSTKFEIDFSNTGGAGYAKLDVTNKSFETKSDLTIDNQLAATATVTAAQFSGVDELSLHSTGNGGTNVVTLLTIADSKSLVIDGNVDLTITVANSLKVNAEDFEGDLKLTTATAKAMQIVGGTGDDTIVAKGGAKGSVEFDGKAGGNDTLDVSAATATAVTAIANVEMTTFKDANAGDVLKFGTTATFDKVAVDVSATSDLLSALNLATAGAVSTDVIKHFTFDGDTYVVADMSSATSLDTTDVVVKLVGTGIDLSKAIYDAGTDTLTFA